LEGSETIRFRNTATRPIGRVAFRFDADQLSLRGAERVPGVKSPVLFDLAKAIAPRETAELVAEWAITGFPLKDGDSLATSGWYPRLYWGFGTLDDYEVKARVPAGLTFAAGKLQDGVYRAAAVRAYGIFVGKGFQTATAALRLPGAPEVRHDQYRMKTNKPWVEERLKTPFTRER
jgi:hypothetical protein